MIGDDFEVFKRIIQYSESTGKEISPVIDISIGLLLLEVIPYLISVNPSNIRFIYHKINGRIRHYESIHSLLNNEEIPYSFTTLEALLDDFWHDVDHWRV